LDIRVTVEKSEQAMLYVLMYSHPSSHFGSRSHGDNQTTSGSLNQCHGTSEFHFFWIDYWSWIEMKQKQKPTLASHFKAWKNMGYQMVFKAMP